MDIRENQFTMKASLLALVISALAGCGGGGGSSSGGESGRGNQTPDPVVGTETDAKFINFESENITVSEADGWLNIKVIRSGNLSEVATVDFDLSGGSADEGEDFEFDEGSLQWSAGESEKTMRLKVNIDPLGAESTETVILRLSNPSGAELGQTSTTTISISNIPCEVINEFAISQSRTLSHPCYLVERDIIVRDAATLSISPNVHLFFTSGTKMQIDNDGILDAVGTEANPVVFTGEINTPAYWDGIEIRSLAPSTMNYTTVENGGAPGTFIKANLGVVSNGILRLTNSTIRKSGQYGILVSGSSSIFTEFSSNTITQNAAAPVVIPGDQVGYLKPDSSFTGNVSESGEVYDYIEVKGNTITRSQKWENLGVPYRLNSQDVSSVLQVAPGTTLEFLANAQLNIKDDGTLKAIGTEALPILFTGLEKSPGYWKGIQFTFNNQANEMDYTIVEYGGGPGSNSLANVGVFGSNGRLSIKNSVLQFSERSGFSFDREIALNMQALLVTDNASPGEISFTDTSLLDSNSIYSGNADDRVKLTYNSIRTVAPSQVLKKLDVPYFVSYGGITTVWNNLEILAGVEIQFAGNGGFNVDRDASLAIKGTEESPVLITGAQKTKGYWNGIQYTFSNSPDNLIEHAIIEYAGARSGNTDALVGLFGGPNLPTRLTLRNTTLRGSLNNGLELSRGSTVSLSGNTFSDIDGQDILDPR